MIRSVIFDLEGVLADTRGYQLLAWKKLSDEQGITLSTEDAERLLDKSRIEGIRMLLKKARRPYSEYEMMALSMQKSDLFSEYSKNMSEKDILPGAVSNIERLIAKGIPVAVISSGMSGRYILNMTGLSRYFNVIVDGSDIRRFKPDPEIFRKAAEGLGCAYNECLAVDNSVNGIRAAKKLGMTTLAVREAMTAREADYCANGLDTIDVSGLIE